MDRRGFVDRLGSLLGATAAHARWQSEASADGDAAPDSTVPVARYGAVGNGVADDAAAIQAAVQAAHGLPHGGTVTFHAGNYRCLSAITLWPNVSLKGSGIYATTLSFAAATHGVVLRAPKYDTQTREISGLAIAGKYGVSRVGLDLANVSQLRLERVWVTGFTEHGIRCVDFDHVILDGVQVGGNGRGTPNVYFDTTERWQYSSNGIFARDVWISAGNTPASCALQIDRTAMITWLGGTIESSGVGLKLGAVNPGHDEKSVSQATFIGVDFENCAKHYVEIGSAWQARSVAVRGAHFLSCSGSLSGSRDTPVGFIVRSCDGFEARSHGFVLSTPGVALFDFVGREQLSFELSPATNLALGGGAYVRIDGVPCEGVSHMDRVVAGRTVFVNLAGSRPSVRRMI